MISRRATLGAAISLPAATRFRSARAATAGVTADEIRIGNTMPYSGPGSAYGVVGRFEAAYFKMVNESGGIAGRKINFISYDDALSPPKTVEAVRRLVEEDNVAFLFSMLGTATNAAVVDNLNRKKIPHLFVATGGSKWGDYKKYPWTIGLQPSYRTEAQVYAKYILKQFPDAKIAILYQNDDLGKDYVAGVKDVLGSGFDRIVTLASYEVTDPTIDSQINVLQASGANVLIGGVTNKAAAQAIRKVHDIGWKPHFFMTNVSISVGSVLEPAGTEKAIGLISAGFIKDPAGVDFKADPGLQEWRTFMAKYLPAADTNDSYYVLAYNECKVMLQVLRQCNGDFSRENVMRQAENLHDFEVPTLLPGIKVNTGPTNHRPIQTLQLQKWDGKNWVRFGDLIDGVQQS